MYHFVKIKQNKLTALARVMIGLGYEIEGSDTDINPYTEQLLHEKEIPLVSEITQGSKVIVGDTITEAEKESLEFDHQVYTDYEMIARLTEKFKTICIAGNHAKTSAASYMKHLFEKTKGCNYLIGNGEGEANLQNEYFVVEASENDKSFLLYRPYYAIITNIDRDHIQSHRDMDLILGDYQDYANKAEKLVIACGDDPYTHSLEVNSPIFYYGLDPDNDIVATEIEYKASGTSFEVEAEGNYYGFFDLPIYGKQQLLTALAVISVAYYERMEAKEVAKIMKVYPGTLGKLKETKQDQQILIEEANQHPSEMNTILKACKQKYENKPVYCLFNPDTFSQLEELQEDFETVFAKMDGIIWWQPTSLFPNLTNVKTLTELPKEEFVLLLSGVKTEAYLEK